MVSGTKNIMLIMKIVKRATVEEKELTILKSIRIFEKKENYNNLGILKVDIINQLKRKDKILKKRTPKVQKNLGLQLIVSCFRARFTNRPRDGGKERNVYQKDDRDKQRERHREREGERERGYKGETSGKV